MNSAIDKLAKYMALEAERGYDNGAVVGGLPRMLEPWQAEARDLGVPSEVIDLVVARLQDYPRLSPGSREETLQGLWHRLGAEYPELGELAASDQVSKTLRTTAPSADKEAGPVRKAEISEEAEILTDPGKEKSAAPEAATQTESVEEKPVPAEAATQTEPAEDKSAEKAAVQTEPTQERSEPEEISTQAEPVEVQSASARATKESEQVAVSLSAELTSVPGIGPKSAKTLQKLDLETLGDLLWHLPRRYDDYSQLKTINRLELGEDVTIIGTVDEISVRPVRGGKLKLVEAVVSDGTGSLAITWFNQAWIANRLKPGKAVVLSGSIEQYLGKPVLTNPEWEPLDQKQVHTNRIVPVYPLTAGITAKWLRRVINSVVSTHAGRVPDPLPEALVTHAGLMPYNVALQQVHFPDSWDMLSRAQRRLAFNEMLLLQLGILRRDGETVAPRTDPIAVDEAFVEEFIARMPFELTDSQREAIRQVVKELESEVPMNRLLQGDVGSGKTVVAAAAIGIATSQGYQAALMAPTSILAEQHFVTLRELLPDAAGIPDEDIRLLLGSTPETEKEEIRSGIEAGEIHCVVGTHALLEESVTFAKLNLVVIDEQHRFGVAQRGALRAKGIRPNLIVMTATPIPRSLALTIYGDLALTVIDEMPPGRQPIETRVFRPIERSRAHNFVRGQLETGRQAFIIYPLVEGSEKVQAKAAVDEHAHLQENAFPEYRLGLLHGRLKQEEKERVMRAFRAGEYEVLVSTSVVEVGVDVPNASVMLVEGADRFGLSQLHQFRGRVGRGKHKSYCLLIPTNEGEADNERLQAMEKTSDGFVLADMDLEQRGPGDFLDRGLRQSGALELRAARLTDVRLIEQARREADRLISKDPSLEAPEHQALSRAVDEFWSNGKGEIS